MNKQKISKAEAKYRNFSFKKNCIDCNMFVKPDDCILVKGTILRQGTCKYWEPKKGLPVEKAAV